MQNKSLWRHKREVVALAVDIVLSDSLKGGSPLSELPGLAVFGRGGSRDKRLPCYLCVKVTQVWRKNQKQQPSVCSVFYTL